MWFFWTLCAGQPKISLFHTTIGEPKHAHFRPVASNKIPRKDSGPHPSGLRPPQGPPFRPPTQAKAHPRGPALQASHPLGPWKPDSPPGDPTETPRRPLRRRPSAGDPSLPGDPSKEGEALKCRREASRGFEGASKLGRLQKGQQRGLQRRLHRGLQRGLHRGLHRGLRVRRGEGGLRRGFEAPLAEGSQTLLGSNRVAVVGWRNLFNN